jgi:hypothetical protein
MQTGGYQPPVLLLGPVANKRWPPRATSAARAGWPLPAIAGVRLDTFHFKAFNAVLRGIRLS